MINIHVHVQVHTVHTYVHCYYTIQTVSIVTCTPLVIIPASFRLSQYVHQKFIGPSQPREGGWHGELSLELGLPGFIEVQQVIDLQATLLCILHHLSHLGVAGLLLHIGQQLAHPPLQEQSDH